MNRIGIMGGTFNPVHNGHISIAAEFKYQLELDHLFFVPAGISPFKIETSQKTDNMSQTTASNQQRVEMLQLAIMDTPDCSIDLFEVEKGGVSYSVDTVRHYRHKYPEAQLFLLIGDDQALDFIRWKNWQEIMNSVQLCIAKRLRHSDYSEFKKQIENLLAEAKSPFIWLENDLVEVSSDRIRNEFYSNIEIRNFLNPMVTDYILTNNLYS